MSKKLDSFIRDLFQKPYDYIENIKLPPLIVMVTSIVSKHLKMPMLGEVVKVAYEISKEAEREKIPGYIKKQKVVSGITKFAKTLGFEIPATVANFLNELVAVYVKVTKEF